jgi:hypothetical protein
MLSANSESLGQAPDLKCPRADKRGLFLSLRGRAQAAAVWLLPFRVAVPLSTACRIAHVQLRL